MTTRTPPRSTTTSTTTTSTAPGPALGQLVDPDTWHQRRDARRRTALARAGLDDDVMSVRDLAHYPSLSLNTTYAYLADGTIPGRRIGRRWLVSRARITAWLVEENTEGGGR